MSPPWVTAAQFHASTASRSNTAGSLGTRLASPTARSLAWWVRLRAKWAALPVWAKWVLALYMIGFADGTADHVRWMTHGGIHAYASCYPQIPIQVFFVILVVADPLIVVLLGLVQREGIWLACTVTDAPAARTCPGSRRHE